MKALQEEMVYSQQRTRSPATRRLYSSYKFDKNEGQLVDPLHAFPTTLMEICTLGYIQVGPNL